MKSLSLRAQVFSSFQNLRLLWSPSAALTVFVLMLGLFSGCGKISPEEQMVWNKYENYRYLDWWTENKAGISVESNSQEIFKSPWNRIPMGHLREAMRAKSLERGTLVYSEHIRPDVSKEFFQEKDVLVIKLTNPKMLERLSENEKYADDYSKRFYVLNAETLENMPVSILPWVTKAEVYGYENIKRDKVDFFQDYFNGFVIDFKNQPVEKAKFILVCFQGISKAESEELETLPLFYVVERNQDYYSTVLTRTPKLLGDSLKKNTAVAASASAATAATASAPATVGAGKAKASQGKTRTPKSQDSESTKRAAEKGDAQAQAYPELRSKEASAFVADTSASVALSSGWEGEVFTAIISVSGGSAKGKWKISVSPPFPHRISGLKDSYVQTAIGMALVGMDTAAGMSWLLKAAKQNQIDAIMLIAVNYARNQQVKNTVEAEHWFRKATTLGNSEAEKMLNDLLAGNLTETSFRIANSYKFNFKQLK